MLLGLLGLFGFVELAEQLEDVGKGTFSSLDALRIVAFSLPRIGIDVLPVACLLGTVVGLGALANQSEITAMRAGGTGFGTLARPLAMLLAVIIVSVAALQQFVIPDFERRSAGLRAQAIANTTVQDGEHWTRSGSSLVRVGNVRYGTVPLDIEIYAFDTRGAFLSLTRAASADIVGANEWLLHDVSVTHLESAGAVRSHTDRLAWKNRIGAEQLAAFVQADHALAPTDLADYIGYLRDNELDAHRYQLLLWHQFEPASRARRHGASGDSLRDRVYPCGFPWRQAGPGGWGGHRFFPGGTDHHPGGAALSSAGRAHQPDAGSAGARGGGGVVVQEPLTTQRWTLACLYHGALFQAIDFIEFVNVRNRFFDPAPRTGVKLSVLLRLNGFVRGPFVVEVERSGFGDGESVGGSGMEAHFDAPAVILSREIGSNGTGRPTSRRSPWRRPASCRSDSSG